MVSRKQTRCTTLTADQINTLLVIIAENYGSMLSQQPFNQVVLMMCEDIAGLEVMNNSKRTQLLKILWSQYRRTKN
ncbi:MAG: hypothetical protein AB7Q04_13485 [Steroidobacteraceae bacterium]